MTRLLRAKTSVYVRRKPVKKKGGISKRKRGAATKRKKKASSGRDKSKESSYTQGPSHAAPPHQGAMPQPYGGVSMGPMAGPEAGAVTARVAGGLAMTPSAPADLSQPVHSTVAIGGRKGKKKGGKVKKRKLGGSHGNRNGDVSFVQRVGPVHTGFSTWNSLLDAENAVRAAMTNRNERQTMDYRMKRLKTLQRAQMPDTFHAGTPVPQPTPVNVPGAIITNPGAQGNQMYGPSPVSNVNSPVMTGVPGDMGRRAEGGPDQPHYPNNMLAAADEFVPVGEAMPGDTVWDSKRDIEGRHGSGTNEFLERTLQNVPDDRTREMGFNLLDSTEFEVVPGQDTSQLTLRNMRQPSKMVTLSEEEFLRAVSFFADPAAPPLVSAPHTKTIELFHVLTPLDDVMEAFEDDNYMISFGDFEYSRKFEEATHGMSPKQKELFKDELGWQAMLDRYRDRLEPVRMVQRSRTWKQLMTAMLTLGVGGQPSPATSVDTIVRGMSNASQMQKEEAKRALEDMRTYQILDWDEKGTILRPKQNPSEATHEIVGSNIFNVVNNVFSPDKVANRTFVSHFKPIGEEFFVQSVVKAMSVREKNLQPGISSLSGMLGTATGTDKPFMRVVDGGESWNLIDMARYFQPIGAFLGMTYPIWTTFLIHASDLTISQFGKIMQYLSPLRERARAEFVTWKMLETAGSVLDKLPQAAQNTINSAAFRYGGQITERAESAAQQVVAQTAVDSVRGAMSYAQQAAAVGASATVGGLGALGRSAFNRVYRRGAQQGP